MALILMGVLLILGVVFIALVNRNIRGAQTTQKRSESYDLAEAGVRYVHQQMLGSLQGADWRPTPTAVQVAPNPPIPLDDPDYEYLRLPDGTDPTDMGGPDKLGAYVRVGFDRGRALVRVRYAPGDPNIFNTNQVGDFLAIGKARNYTIIESVGKVGRVVPNDPTSRTERGTLNIHEQSEPTKLVAFVTTGLTEQALNITNINNTTHPAEIGFDENVGATYGETGTPANVLVPVLMGTSGPMFNPSNGGALVPSPTPISYGGGIRSNTDLVIYGNIVTNLNALLGDSIVVAGSIIGATDSAALTVNYALPNGTAWNSATQVLQNNTSPSLNSNSPNFNTIFSLIRDGAGTGDSSGYPRSAQRIESPLITATDADTGQNRYVQMTQNSGRLYDSGNGGQRGHGQGVFVNNDRSRQMRSEEQGREDLGTAESLVYDWLNPNNGQRGNGWKGPFYVPPGAYVRLLNDGFIIIRDDAKWREPDGSPSKRPGAAMTSTNSADILDSPLIRYKLRKINGVTYILNSYSVNNAGIVIDLVNATNADFVNSGFAFNGVLYFEGNVRIRGEIPTDEQITVVSNATIYIEGSITKGISTNGARINVPSKSMLALLAKDYVTINTTQFFGPDPQQQLEEVNDVASSVQNNPVRIRTGDGINLATEFLLDPNAAGANAQNPTTWPPAGTEYLVAGSATNHEYPSILMKSTMDDGPAPATFVTLDLNSGVGTPPYLFELDTYNAATPFYPAGYTAPGYTVPDRAPLYGPSTRYTKFEGRAFPLLSANFTYNAANGTLTGTNTNVSGLYTLLVDSRNDFSFGQRNSVGSTPTNDWLLARAAIVPHDIKIEATIMAEQGSFFVIPGPWFNPDPNDRRDTYASLGTTDAERQLARLEKTGNFPQVPFYGEPLDVKVTVVGSVTENLPPPISQQAEWQKKWGWIPRLHGATTELIPQQHVPNGFDVTGTDLYVPNFAITYDPALATGRNGGFVGSLAATTNRDTLIRTHGIDVDGDGAPDIYEALPPLPRLPVSSTLAYFGEVKK